MRASSILILTLSVLTYGKDSNLDIRVYPGDHAHCDGHNTWQEATPATYRKIYGRNIHIGFDIKGFHVSRGLQPNEHIDFYRDDDPKWVYSVKGKNKGCYQLPGKGANTFALYNDG
ncbi:MAG: hypothetical protein L6R41_003206 [Letrouitia leprolyta]|nr:MAG: hypothetical protein L6R41_003206 [Letrouitia leprolyta]